MTDQPSEVEKKLIEFAAKTADTIQSQAGQIHAVTQTLLIALVSLSEQQPQFKKDFIQRIELVRDHMSDGSVDQFTKEFFDELIPFLQTPYSYSAQKEGRPSWFKGIILGGKDSEPPQNDD